MLFKIYANNKTTNTNSDIELKMSIKMNNANGCDFSNRKNTRAKKKKIASNECVGERTEKVKKQAFA